MKILNKFSLISFLTVVSIIIPTEAFARPAEEFTPYLDTIKSTLPVGLIMRLPSKLFLPEIANLEAEELVVRLFPADNPRRFTVSLFTCERSSHPCLIGSFTVENGTNPSAQLEFERHQQKGETITLSNDSVGYLIEGYKQNPSTSFSSIIWRQDTMIYTLNFSNIGRQNLLFMATSMSAESAIYRQVTPNPID